MSHGNLFGNQVVHDCGCEEHSFRIDLVHDRPCNKADREAVIFSELRSAVEVGITYDSGLPVPALEKKLRAASAATTSAEFSGLL